MELKHTGPGRALRLQIRSSGFVWLLPLLLLGACQSEPPVPPELPALQATISAPELSGPLYPSSVTSLSLVLHNTGSEEWTAGKKIALALQSPEASWAWVIGDRIFLHPSQSIAPGEDWKCSILLAAPQSPGKYQITLQMLQEGHSRFGQRKELELQVEEAQETPVPSKSFDTLDFFLNRTGQSLEGTHPLRHVVRETDAFLVKWSPASFEWHSWDAERVYLKEDHSGNQGDFYSFSNGVWMLRQMEIGESVLSGGNNIQWYDSDCQKTRRARFPYRTTLESHWPEYDFQGEIGKRETLVLRYDYAYGTGFERFYYAKGLGLLRWEQANARLELQHFSLFNRHSKSSFDPVAPCSEQK